jgi:hypothetical protein
MIGPIDDNRCYRANGALIERRARTKNRAIGKGRLMVTRQPGLMALEIRPALDRTPGNLETP